MDRRAQEIVEDVIRSRMAGSEIVQIHITEGEDHDGDPVLRVMVVFDPAKGRLDPRRMAGLARHLRSRLGPDGVAPYPVFQFVSKSDAKKLSHAAA
jgi:hypothetical protein